MQISFSLTFADIPTAGRVDHSSLSEESVMELLTADMEGVGDLQDDQGILLPLEICSGLTLHDSGEVKQINWGRKIGFNGGKLLVRPKGEIHLQWLPRRLEMFNIFAMGLAGEMHTDWLPKDLITLICSHNELTGEIHTEHLPANIEMIEVTNNLLGGTLDLKSLPSKVRRFNARCNAFTGNLDLSSLPESLETLVLLRNNFCASVHLKHSGLHGAPLYDFMQYKKPGLSHVTVYVDKSK